MASTGFDSEFLPVTVEIPAPTDSRAVRMLPYVHFTVLQDPARRLPVSTGVNIDGGALVDVEREDDWHLDPRIPASEQAGPELYAGNDLDRGHQVRRRDPVWGDPAVAATANAATFVYTNCAPQVAVFNQSQELWAGLEDYVLGYARTSEQKISVFTAPVLAADDPTYRGVRIPRLFWKVAAWTEHRANGTVALAATGYVLDQTPELDDVGLATRRALAAGDPPPLGPYKTYQVPIADIGALTGLDVEQLAAADRFAPVAAPHAASGRAGWVRLASFDDITLSA
ncbi:DNA/RNA non-specific endonuclease [Leifsonia sp. NPDC058230]|uniref:DNA/RNA non-specific endonuclease n=1 Tax=Leifsonia sp. NPDC058230 TaxID=3346391 RepID=UPI0036DBBB31